MSESAAPSVARPTTVTSRGLAWGLTHRWPLGVGAAVSAWTLSLVAIVWNRFADFQLGRFDLGNMVQAVWSTAHGRPLETTNFSGDDISRLGSHVDPILATLAPLWIVAPSPVTLLVVNVVAIALGALPVYWLARRHLRSEKVATFLALSYLFYPWVAWAALDAFHPVTLALPLLLFSIWFLDTDRLLPFSLCAVLALTTGELVGVTIAALGVWYAVARSRRSAGLVIAGIALAWSVLAVYVVIPHFANGPSEFYGYYASVGGSPGGVVRTLFTDPGAIARALIGSRDIVYVVALLVPFVGASLRAPGLAAVAVPQLLAGGLSDNLAMTNPRDHYSATAIPFLVAAAVLGLARAPEGRRVLLATVVLTTTLASALLVGPWPGTPGDTRTWDTLPVSTRHVDALRDAVALVPDGVPVSATNKAGSHLSARRDVYTPLFIGRARWIVLDTEDPFIANPGLPVLEKNPRALERFEQRIDRSARWTKVYDRDGVFVYKRVPRA
jgi:uncharacterized membrane protein